MKIGNLPLGRALERVLELQRRLDAGLPFTEGRLAFLEHESLLGYMGLAKAQVDPPRGVPVGSLYPAQRLRAPRRRRYHGAPEWSDYTFKAVRPSLEHPRGRAALHDGGSPPVCAQQEAAVVRHRQPRRGRLPPPMSPGQPHRPPG